MRRRSGLFVVFFLAFLILAVPVPALAQGRHVDVLTVDGVINPVTAGYISWGIRTAQEDGAVCVIIRLDTPGGLMDSTNQIVQAIMNAEVPVVVYVFPRGARAASAGVYITYASHVAAMAPGTRIGAATPISINEQGEPEQVPEELQSKIEQDALAGLRASAQERGRNIEWAEKAVKEAASATASEALELGVVEIVAGNLQDLLSQLDGRQVALASGERVTLHTAGASVSELPMSFITRFLLVITDPTIAYLLLSLGLLGLWIEFSNPGVSLPGVLGGVCILLSLYALGTLPVNWAGVLLIVLGFIFFAFDIFATSHLVLTTGGIVALVAGSLLLFHSAEPYLRVEPWAIALVAGLVLLVVILILYAAVRGQRRPVVSGPEALVGMIGIARENLAPEGMIFVDGALWRARSEEGPIQAGESVEVISLEGLLLHVRRPREKRT
ncbi:MAG: NfeD family protein [Chloroflexia bacterium]